MIRYTHWQAFREAGLYVGEDLTPFEADERQQICQIMKGYWGIPTIPYARFSRNLLKCTLKESGRPVQLSLAQVEQYTAEQRIAPYQSKNAVSSGTS